MNTTAKPDSTRQGEEQRLLAAASAAGLVSHRELVAGAVTVRDVSRSNSVHAVLVSGLPVAYVKEPRAGTGAAERERIACSVLAELELAPRLVAHETGELLWVGAVPGTPIAGSTGDMSELAEVCRTWGSALATLHTSRVPSRSVPLAPRPSLAGFGDHASGRRTAPLGSGYATVLRALRSDPLLRGVAAEVADRWTEQCWIHGDLSGDNVVVHRAPDLQVRFVDFEDSGIGDPSWDVAGALETIQLLAAGWGVAAELLTEYFLRGYQRGSGPGRVDPGMRALRAVGIAWQLAAGEQDGLDPALVRTQVQAWLARARALAGGAGRAFTVAA